MFNSVRNTLSKYKLIFAPTIVVLLTIWAFVQLYFSFFILPQSNDECLWIPVRHQIDSINNRGVHIKWEKSIFKTKLIKIKSVKKNGVTWNAGIRDGDILLKINGVKIKKLSSASYILDNISAGDTAIYTVKRGEKVFTAKVRVKKLLPFGSIASEIFALVWLIVGFIVYTSKPSGEIQERFFSLGILLVLFNSWTLISGSSISTPFSTNISLAYITTALWLVPGIFIPTKIIEFFWIFPVRRKIFSKKVVRFILSAYPFFLVLVYFGVRFFIVPKFPVSIMPYRFFAEKVMWKWIFFSIIFALFVGFISMIRAYRSLETKESKKPIAVIISGFAIGLGGVVYVSTLAKVFADSIFNSPQHYMPIILLALIPISFAYSIFKYSLMDVSEVVKNTFLYILVSIAIAAVYFFSILFLGASFISALGPQYQGLIIGVVFVIFVILYQSTKDKFQDAITKKFYPEQKAFKNLLVKFSNDISGIVDYDGVILQSKKIFANSLKIKAFGFAVYDRKKEKLKLAADENFVDSELEIPLSVKTLEDWIKGRRYYREFLNIEREDFETVFGEHAPKLIHNNIFTAMPLVARDKLIGFLFFGLKHSGARFTDADLEMLSATVNQVAVALENARFHNEEKEKVAMERDFENARKIQRSLLPREIPEIDGVELFGEMIPAQWVGGDYYDIIKISDSRFYVVVGDVSGKGFSASFYMSKLQTMVRLFCAEGLQPAEILSKINDKITSALEKFYFITLSIALFDTGKNTLTFVRAGHTPLKKISRKSVENILPKGLALGMKAGETFDEILEQVEIVLEKDNIFIFYSDGINEEMNDKNELLGDEFIDKTVGANFEKPVREIWERLIDGVKLFRGESEQRDDITVVIVRTN